MIAALAQNEWRSLWRNGVFVGLAAGMLALSIGAASLSFQRIATFDRERAAAEAVDREVWDNQGERNPHSAAHFARYAFKPIPRLAGFDPGVTDYTGLALWMEAHHQNPAVFRRAEDLGDAGRFADLSPAWILQYAAPLFLFLILFGSVAGEREQGTLRQLAATGLPSRAVLLGKLSGAGLAALAIITPTLLLSLLVISTGGSATLSDIGVRTIGLVLAYALYLTAILGIAIGVSALAREKRTALIALVAVWAGAFVLLPRITAGLAVAIHPSPAASSMENQLGEASMAYYVDEELQESLKASLLAENGVDKVEELPFDYNGYTLQFSEEHAHPLFEAVYDRLDRTYQRQDGLLALASLASPVLAIDALSAGLAGTDRLHHDAFRWDAEAHRRTTVKALNDDMTYNSGNAGYAHIANEDLWHQIEDFDHTPPPFSSIWARYWLNILVLMAYAVGGMVFAVFAMGRAQREVAR
ncbi:MAG: DUF3526 domain-containing protein [Pseudomonadota bacterium]